MILQQKRQHGKPNISKYIKQMKQKFLIISNLNMKKFNFENYRKKYARSTVIRPVNKLL